MRILHCPVEMPRFYVFRFRLLSPSFAYLSKASSFRKRAAVPAGTRKVAQKVVPLHFYGTEEKVGVTAILVCGEEWVRALRKREPELVA